MKKQNIATVCVFGIALLLLSALLFLSPHKEYSAAERRLLAKPPRLSGEAVLSGKYMTDAEKYLLDQFPFRDELRALKAGMRLYLFRQKDNNGLFVFDGGVYKLDDPLKEAQAEFTADKINDISQKYFAGMNVYYSIIPDKNYFVAAQNGYPSLDYGRLAELMRDNVTETSYIDIFGSLSAEDYYRTDPHWRQERILPAADALLQGLGSEYRAGKDEFAESTLYPFNGAYSGQLALPVQPDELKYLTNPTIQTCSAEILGKEGAQPVYSPEDFYGTDGYDVFLSGAQPLITITNPAAKEQRELIIFRDSYGSSIAPLLLGGYSKITLVDLRYFSSDLLADYIEFVDQDVLFLYSTTLIASGMLLR